MNEQTFTSLLVDAFDAAPTHIQAFIEKGGLHQLAASLQQRLKLEASTMDRVTNEIVFMLLGITDAKDFPSELAAAGIAPDIGRQVVESVGKEVVPLLAKQAGSNEKTQTPEEELLLPPPQNAKPSTASVPLQSSGDSTKQEGAIRSSPVPTRPVPA